MCWLAGRQNRRGRRQVAALGTVVWALASWGQDLAAAEGETSQTTQTLKNLSMEELMEVKVDTVFGASKHEQKITEAPSAVSIVTADDIKQQGVPHAGGRAAGRAGVLCDL